MSDYTSSVTATNHPLVANYTLSAPAGSTMSVNFGPTTAYGFSTWTLPAPAGGGPLTILVAGMQASSAYHMQAVVTLQDGSTVNDQDHTFQTGELPPDDIPQLSVKTNTAPNAGVELVNMNPGCPVVCDLEGNIIWFYLDQPVDIAHDGHPMPLKILANGNVMALITNRYTADGQSDPYGVLREVDLSCTTISNQYGVREISLSDLNAKLQNIRTPFGSLMQVKFYSHDFLPLPNGHLIALCQLYQDGCWGDALVDLDESLTPVWVWSIYDVLNLNRHPYRWDPFLDWTHSNCVQLTPDGNLLLSVRNQSWILKIDYAGGTGKILWKLGYEGDFALTGGAPDAWFFAQHFPNILNTSGSHITRLGVIDNGNYQAVGDPPFASKAMIVNIDEGSRTASVGWQDPVSPNYFSYWGGSIDVLGNGNVEYCMSDPYPDSTPPYSFAREVTLSNEIVWEMNISPSYAYRCYRIPSLYPGVQW